MQHEKLWFRPPCGKIIGWKISHCHHLLPVSDFTHFFKGQLQFQNLSLNESIFFHIITQMTSVILPKWGLKKKCWEQWTQVIYLHNAVEERVLWEGILRAGVSCQCLKEGDSIHCLLWSHSREPWEREMRFFSIPLLTKIFYCVQGVRDNYSSLPLVYITGLIMSQTQESKRDRERRKEQETQTKRGSICKERGNLKKYSVINIPINSLNHKTDCINVLCKCGLQPFKYVAVSAEEPLPFEGSALGAQHTLAAQSSVISRNHSQGSR